ncbi:DUF6090 family protein [Yeosuana sp. MJ-SS3]|uniref:DUF6090 family protein n=1 Tax=Gilvirhabdus luticola TaxID=3079858 RepID=A0ABU3U2C4_9FLAO|nr:DUF6090 family protein [Yeosuana sp. MJ-SS3]MDU8884555.1 DUF6090 family protein [Yeosuana sp. MJ-SS3]
MIKFFRNIRKTLINQGKTANYLKYAIGEIILVVFGILIALQVNNWNQLREDKKFEITMLQEIKSSLESDLEFSEMINRRLKVKEEGIQELLKMTASNQKYSDSILLEVYNKMNTGVSFNINKGSYEAIKSVGIDKISNDSLRKMLIQTYEVRFPMVEQVMGNIFEDIDIKDYKLKLHNALWKRIRIQLPNKSFKLVSRPINNENFLSQTELVDRIKIEQDFVSAYSFWMSHFQGIVQYCLGAVNQELNND